MVIRRARWSERQANRLKPALAYNIAPRGTPVGKSGGLVSRPVDVLSGNPYLTGLGKVCPSSTRIHGQAPREIRTSSGRIIGSNPIREREIGDGNGFLAQCQLLQRWQNHSQHRRLLQSSDKVEFRQCVVVRVGEELTIWSRPDCVEA